MEKVKLTNTVTLTVAQLKNIFLEGKQRASEEIEVEMGDREPDHYDALDFGDYIKAVHDIDLE